MGPWHAYCLTIGLSNFRCGSGHSPCWHTLCMYMQVLFLSFGTLVAYIILCLCKYYTILRTISQVFSFYSGILIAGGGAISGTVDSVGGTMI